MKDIERGSFGDKETIWVKGVERIIEEVDSGKLKHYSEVDVALQKLWGGKGSPGPSGETLTASLKEALKRLDAACKAKGI
mgnify:CR=1 FL=1